MMKLDDETIDILKTIIEKLQNESKYGKGYTKRTSRLFKFIKYCNISKKQMVKLLTKKYDWFYRQRKQGEWAFSLKLSATKQIIEFLDADYKNAKKIFNK